ncbi:MAG: hypothetical protein GY906_34310, partial [bacterium]|nr:hypothetical protein [bacterium]
NLRGQSIPVIDAKAQLTQRARKPRLSDVVIVCSDGVRPVGLLVQEVVGAHRIATNDIEQTPDGLAFAPYLLGIIRPEQTPTLLISIEAVVARSNLPEEEP